MKAAASSRNKADPKFLVKAQAERKKEIQQQVKKRTKKDFGDGNGEVSCAKIKLLSPVCTRVGEKIALSRRVDKHWRLIGWGEVSDGMTINLE